jgi:hypothetical protein
MLKVQYLLIRKIKRAGQRKGVKEKGKVNSVQGTQVGYKNRNHGSSEMGHCNIHTEYSQKRVILYTNFKQGNLA